MPDDNTLDPSESTDSDEIRNDDGDAVINPPDGWSEADKFGMTAREEREGESLDDRLAEEEPDVLENVDPVEERPTHIHRGQVSGTPEDGDSVFG